MQNGAGIPLASSGGSNRVRQQAAAFAVSRCSPVAVAGAGLLLPEGFSRYRPEPG